MGVQVVKYGSEGVKGWWGDEVKGYGGLVMEGLAMSRS